MSDEKLETNPEDESALRSYIVQLEKLASEMSGNAQKMVEQSKVLSPEALELAMIASKVLGQVDDLKSLVKKFRKI